MANEESEPAKDDGHKHSQKSDEEKVVDNKIVNQDDLMMPTAEKVGVVDKFMETLKDVTNAAKDKVVEFEKKTEGATGGSLGPYESTASCAPHEFDPVASAVYSGITLGEKEVEEKGGGGNCGSKQCGCKEENQKDDSDGAQ